MKVDQMSSNSYIMDWLLILYRASELFLTPQNKHRDLPFRRAGIMAVHGTQSVIAPVQNLALTNCTNQIENLWQGQVFHGGSFPSTFLDSH